MRRTRRIVSVLLAVILGFGQTRLLAHECGGTGAAGGITEKGTIDANGVRHIHYSLPGTMPADLTNAMAAAFNEWNGKSNTTGIVFDPDGNDITFVEDTAFLDGHDLPCAGEDGNEDVIRFEIYFATEFDRIRDIDDESERQQAFNEFFALTRTVFAHEIGHFLGLKQQGATSGSIMAGAQSGSSCASAIQTIPSDARSVTDWDAGNARVCATLLVEDTTPFDGGGYSDDGPADEYGEDYENCWAYVWVHQTYHWVGGGWSLWYEDYTVLWIDCSPRE